MNLIRLINRATLHIFGYRSLLVWSLFAYFICTSCSSMQVSNGVEDDKINLFSRCYNPDNSVSKENDVNSLTPYNNSESTSLDELIHQWDTLSNISLIQKYKYKKKIIKLIKKKNYIHEIIKRRDESILKILLRKFDKKSLFKLLDKKDPNDDRPLDVAAIQFTEAIKSESESESAESKKKARKIFKILIDQLKSIDTKWMNSNLYTNKVRDAMPYLTILNHHIKLINRNEVALLQQEEEEKKKQERHKCICLKFVFDKQDKDIVKLRCCDQYLHKSCLVEWYEKKETNYLNCPFCRKLLEKINIVLK